MTKLRTLVKTTTTLLLVALLVLTNTLPALAATFTAGMAKRTGKLFAGAPIVQGKLNASDYGDVFQFGRGSQIYGKFYSNFDMNQGTISLFITPEWNGNDGSYHELVRPSTYFRLEKNGSSLVFILQNGISKSVDVSNWTTGTTYSVIIRWDSNNTLDGTNYASISINDSHSFGVTTAPNSSFDFSSIFLGYYNAVGAARNADAIIEGLTIYRRPLFDGTYGVDVGNGDEIAQIYNSGSFKDPTEVTGSWDVTFALPTNSSTGALATGTGEAWSHPHSSNLLYTSTTNTGGFMMNGTYTSDGWADEGTPSSVAALATSEKLFAGGYKVTSDAANEGIYYDKTVTAGDDWVIRALGNSDGTCSPRVILYDQTNTAEIGHLDGTTTSTRADPDVYIFTGEAPSGMTTLRVKLINTASSGTCYWHQVEVLANLSNNPSLEIGSGDPWIPTGWGNLGFSAGQLEQESTVVHSGSSALQYNSGGSRIRQSISLSLNKYVGTGIYLYQTLRLAPDASDHAKAQSNSGGSITGEASNSWKQFFRVYRSTHAAGTPFFRLETGTGGSTPKYADDVYHIALSDVSLTVSPASEANSSESSGTRVDGLDTYTNTVSEFSTTKGYVQFNFTPRHSFNTANLFGSTAPRIATIYADGNNFIDLYWYDATRIRLRGFFNGSEVDADWTSPTLNAGVTYTIGIRYTNSGNLVLTVDGVQKSSGSGVGTFTTVPTTFYAGTNSSGQQQYDATYNNLVFDSTAPSISLTAYSPDTTSDTTPTLTGTATEAIGTVSSVQFQVDSTAGSWSSCTADDGAFDEASEAFSCTTSALSDGAHTVYVRATDSYSNTTASGSETSDTLTVDSTAPVDFSLVAPSANEYVSNPHPTFRWKTSSDATSSINKYKLTIDNGAAGNIVVDNISPNYSQTALITPKYTVGYETSGGQTYVSVTTTETSLWGQSTNYGKVAEGKRAYSVEVVDYAGNTTTKQAGFFVDYSAPELSGLTLNGEAVEAGKTYATTNGKLELAAKVTDKLTGDSAASTSPVNLVASGPQKVSVNVANENLFGFDTVGIYSTQLTESFWSADGTKITDNNANTSDKYANYAQTLAESLPAGKYLITLTALDTAGNSREVSFYLSVLTSSQAEELIQEVIKQVPAEEQDTTSQVTEEHIQRSIQIPNYTPGFFSGLTQFVGDTLAFVGDKLQLAWNATHTGLTIAGAQIQKVTGDVIAGSLRTGKTAVVATTSVFFDLGRLASGAGQGTMVFVKDNSPAAIAFGVGKIEQAGTWANSGAQKLAGNAKANLQFAGQSVGKAYEVAVANLASAGSQTSQSLAGTATFFNSAADNMAANIAEQTRKPRGRFARIWETAFDKQATRISDVTIVETGMDYALVTWDTNHHTINNKVNFGTTLSYGDEAWGEDYTTHHEARLEGLTPNTEYVFEVMSQNSNYVYDSHYSFTTQSD